MFKPTTTAAAIAPFRKVVQNLKDVVATQEKRKASASEEIVMARETFEAVTTEKTFILNEAEAERAKAAKLMAKLENLLADD